MAKQKYKPFNPYAARQSKYGNKPVTVDGIKYDSVHESQRHAYLKLLERAGEIKDLQYHVKYELIPPIRKEIVCTMKKSGKTFTKVRNEGRYYEADFVYTVVATGEKIVEDFKGMETELFKFKADLFFSKYGIEITIVKQVNEPIKRIK